jgi:hypothetical protein
MTSFRCPDYTETVRIIESTAAQNFGFMRKVCEFVNSYVDTIRHTHDDLAPLTAEAVLARVEGKIADREFPAVTNSDFSRCWRTLLREQTLNPKIPIGEAWKVLNRFLVAITLTAQDYRGKCDSIVVKANESLTKLKAAADAAASAHKSYVECGQAVETSDGQQGSSHPELCRKFAQVQTIAVEKHKEYNAMRGTVTTEFAEYLTDYEQAEETRCSTWGKIHRDFAKDLETVAASFEAAAESVEKSLAWTDDSETKLFDDSSFLKNASASTKFQSIVVPGIASAYLDMRKFFTADIKEGKQLFQATADFNGGVDQLDVVNGEVLLVLEDVGQAKRCKNINECVGLVPAAVLKPVGA